MLQMKPTKHLIGINIRGDFNDLYDLVDSIYGMCGFDERPDSPYYGVKDLLLGMCYEIRHAYQKSRNILVVDNGMDKDAMKWHEITTPTENVYYSTNIFFPEALFVAIALPDTYSLSRRHYGRHSKYKGKVYEPRSLMRFYRDRSNLEVLCAAVWEALGETIGEKEAEKLMEMRSQMEPDYYIDYMVAFVRKCNLRLINTKFKNRRDMLKEITRALMEKDEEYYGMEKKINDWAREFGKKTYQVRTRIEYPEEIEW